MFKRKQTHIIKCALHRKTGKAIHIDKARNGLKCGCYCTVCDKDFVAVQGKSANHREWHFRHEGDKDNTSTCPGGVETALHKLAKQILTASTTIDLPKFGTVHYTDARPEVKHKTTRPDVTVTYKNEPAYFEVAVHHFIEPEKEDFFVSGKYRSVEIDLKNLDPLAGYETVEETVLRNTYNKRVIFWEPEPVNITPVIVAPKEEPKKKPALLTANPVQSLPYREDNWDKIVRFVREKPLESLAILAVALYLVPKGIRWLFRKIFWFLY